MGGPRPLPHRSPPALPAPSHRYPPPPPRSYVRLRRRLLNHRGLRVTCARPALSAPPPPAARAPQPQPPPPPLPLSLRRHHHHCQRHRQRHRHRLGLQPQGEAPDEPRAPPAPSPRRRAPAPLPGTRASLAPRRCAPASPPAPRRHLLPQPSRTARLGFRLSPPPHSRARPLRTCVQLRLSPPLSAPSPCPFSPRVLSMIRFRGLPGLCIFTLARPLALHRGNVFLTLPRRPQTSSRRPSPTPLPHRPLRLQCFHCTGEGWEEGRICLGAGRGPAQPCLSPRVSLRPPPSPRQLSETEDPLADFSTVHLSGRGGTYIWREIGTLEWGLEH